jgi:hypothetical protein
MRGTILLILAATASAQGPLTPQQILDHVRDTYTNVRQYQMAGNLDVTKPWTYDPVHKTYTRQPGQPHLDTDMDDNELKQLGVDPSSSTLVQFAELQLAPYRKLAALAASASMLRVETIQLAGAPVECYVVEAREKQTRQIVWIDTTRFRILRLETSEGQASLRLTFDQVILNEPVPDDLFSFVPPDGATLVEKPR